MVRGVSCADDVHVTDNSGIVRRQLAVGLAGLAVLVTSTVVAVVHSADPASAGTYVTSVRNAVLRTADGKESEPVVGQQVPNGAQIRTGKDGGAELASSGRITYLGALSTLNVLDGVREKLTRGQVMVDSRKGPRLSLTTRAGEVRASAGTLARVETATVLRLGVFDGAAGFTAAGRQATTAVPSLHQVQVPYGFLPGEVTPLALTDDRWETRLASGLVSADQDLTHLAASLDGTDGVVLLRAAPAVLRAALGQGDRGELALSAALAQAAAGSATDNLAQVLADRSGGGSWGVVAALVRARVTSVSHLLDLALAPLVPAQPTFQAAPPITSIPGVLGPQPSASRSATPTPLTTTTRQSTTKPSASPTASPTADPGVVGGLVNTVIGLIKPPAVAKPVAPLPTPSPTKLLGILPLGP
ncbi:MAG: hypothetical protein JWO12_3232 [Frankiales bacterium]|nr:hypothetical protein [Frankiales bacterium]